MCVICASRKGIRQPTTVEIRAMFNRNPDGAGYMYIDKGTVIIRKGFMTVDELLKSLQNRRFTGDDVVIYHFRIATQGGINKEMTQPFPISEDEKLLKATAIRCPIGIAHNGIIPATSNGDSQMSDTAIFIRDYLTDWIESKDRDDLSSSIYRTIGYSKLAILKASGSVVLYGDFSDRDGLMYSNLNHLNYKR